VHKTSRIYVAGHRGLAGSAIVRLLRGQGYENLILRTRAEVDLRNQAAVNAYFAAERPEYVFLAAAKVGGILANSTHPAEFLHDNLAIQSNVMDATCRNGVKKLLFLGSSCIYPKLAPQPIREESLLTGPLESTNEWYAIAKIAGIKMAQAYRQQYGFSAISLMPTNLYGPGDNFDPASSHVLPALIRKFHDARVNTSPEVVVWGTGSPRREFLHVDDLAGAAVFLMLNYDSPEIVNVGVGKDLTIAELAELIRGITRYAGALTFDRSKPDGTPRKLLDVSRLHDLGWKARIPFREGIEATYEWYLAQSAYQKPGAH
jgi:GDP-L-fucose synthase